MKTIMQTHQDGKVNLHNFFAYDDTLSTKRALVLIAPDWSGCNDFAKDKARAIAQLGCIGMVCDVYGEGRTGNTNDEKSALMQPFASNRAFLRERMLALFQAAHAFELADTNKMMAIGFCFGGLCALDLARAGAPLKGVCSFHGLLSCPENLPKQKIHPSILALHGHDDPMVTPNSVLAFEEEMTHAQVDWQVHVYGNTQHAFTNPNAHDTQLGLMYSQRANDRSWVSFTQFLTECVG